MKIKDRLFNKISADLVHKGYNLYETGNDPTFVLKEENRTVVFYFNFLKFKNSVAFSKTLISFNSVEEIILEIGTPTNKFELQKAANNRYYSHTIQDKTAIIDNEIGRMINTISGETEELQNELIENISNYITVDANRFLNKYLTLNNILVQMNLLQKDGISWWDTKKGILCGTIDSFFRGLIIAKLCDDPELKSKELFVDDIIYNNAPDIWFPYYERLKKRINI